MSENADYLYALEMQRRLNGEQNEGDSDIEEIDFKPPPPSKTPFNFKRSNPRSNLDEDFLNRTQNLVHPQWETLDPTPDVVALFGAFDMKFFQGRLKCVTLEWSKRMYSCAGICYSRRNRFGMDVTIRLSEPLLKLRPRKDLVETMLHEMIHAYCFVLNIREGNGGHGPNFKKIMYSINKVAGTNITVYHTFLDEVELYKQHWWRCNGICQERSPFFGYVKRTSNRAPGPNDQWWAQHLESCGGTFMKIKGPEKAKKEKSKENTKNGTDLLKFFKPTKSGGEKHTNPGMKSTSTSAGNLHGQGDFRGNHKGPLKNNGSGTMVINPKTVRSASNNITPTRPTNSSIVSAFPPTSYPGLSSDPFGALNSRTPSSTFAPTGGNLRNVFGFSDLNNITGGTGNSGRSFSNLSTTATSSLEGRGYFLNSTGSKFSSHTSSNNQVDRNHLREIWSKRFKSDSCSSDNAVSENKDNIDNGTSFNSNNEAPVSGDSKRIRLSNEAHSTSSDAANVVDKTKANSDWVVLDDDIMLQDIQEEIIALSSDDSDTDEVETGAPKSRKPLTADERQTAIKQEIIDESIDLEDEDIILIDDEYDDNQDLSAAVELADTSIIDEFFGEDTMLQEFKRENDLIATGSRHLPNPNDDIITCPICLSKMKRGLLSEHLDGCAGISTKVEIPKSAFQKIAATSRPVKPARKPRPSHLSTKDVLRNAGYSDQDLENIFSASSADEDYLSSPPELSEIGDIPTVDPDSSEESSRRYRQRNLFKTTRQCPVCATEIEEDEMNEHLDECLKKRRN